MSRRKRRRGGSTPGFWLRLLTVVLAAVAIAFGMMVFFKVTNIEVVGMEKYSDLQIIESSGVAVGDNLMLFSRSQTANLILDQLPYIKEVRISRRLPGTLVITVVECEAAASVQSDYGDWWLLDEEGRVLEKVSDAKADEYLKVIGVKILAPVSGDELVLPEKDKDKRQAIADILSVLRSYELLGSVRELNIEKSYDITLRYEDRFTVLLGNSSEMDYKVRYLITVMEKLVSNEVGTIDLTFEQEKIAYFRPE